MSHRVTYLCHNTDSVNWGCRATSLALHDCIDGDDRIIAAFPRALALRTIAPLPPLRLPDRVVRLSDRVANRWLPELHAIGADPDRSVRWLETTARSNPVVAELLRAVREASDVVINGEGSMIFRTPARRDLQFQMTMAYAAQRYGIPVHYVNALVSPCPTTGENRRSIEECLTVLAGCTTIVVRDPLSSEYLRDLGYDVDNVITAPDALFSWSQREDVRTRPTAPAQLEPFPERPEPFGAVGSFPTDYVCVSGASVAPGVDRSAWTDRFVQLVEEIVKETDLPVVLAIPDDVDRFLLEVAARTGALAVRPEVPILSASGLLANATAYVSGRYHPSIMAALGGTPLVHFGANSHKLNGLARWLDDSGVSVSAVDGPDFVDVATSALQAQLAAPHRGARAALAAELGSAARSVYATLFDAPRRQPSGFP